MFRFVLGGSIILGVPSFEGIFEFGAQSDVLKRILVLGDYEPELVAQVRGNIDPTRDVMDVGANVGLFTVLASRIIRSDRRVFALEPTPGALRFLRANIERNNVSNAVIFEGAASDQSGEFFLNIMPGREEYSSLVSTMYARHKGASVDQIAVRCEPLDFLVAQHNLSPGFLKIDTEGAEFKVLSGAVEALRRHRPVVVCERWPDEMILDAGGRPGQIEELLRSLDYDLDLSIPGELLAFPR
jgi:FkbM family methyltransferase